MPKLTCPIHGNDLVRRQTQYGGRWFCPAPSCTVCCWEGSTSTPADAETRALRIQCHDLFDKLWKSPAGTMSRKRAYEWMQKVMGLSRDKAHVGMFNKDQCLELLGHLAQEVST